MSLHTHETDQYHTQDETLRDDIERAARLRQELAQKAYAASLEHPVTEFTD